MPGISQKRFDSTIKGPSAEALDILAPHSAEVLNAWSRAISEFGLDPREIVPAERLSFSWLADQLRGSTYAMFRKQVQQHSERLARRGVQLHSMFACCNRFFEICLPYLDRDGRRRATPTLALARLHALLNLLLISGYSGQAETDKKSLVEASLTEAEQRLHGASAYVTHIYESERRRLSQDLHDDVGHDLIMIKLYLELMVLDSQRHGSPAIRSRLQEALALVSHAIISVRRLVLDLGPAVFDELGFIPAVKSYASQFSARTKIKVTIQEGHLPENIPLSHQVALYRLLQGALSNVLKHARAKHVRVSLGSMKGSVLIMVIEDDGVGFSLTEQPVRRSFGLTAMRERVEVLKGRIHIQSKRAGSSAGEHGTRIEVDLPLPGAGGE